MFGLADGEYRQTAGLLRVGDGRADTIGWFPADTGRTDIGEVPVPRPYLPTAEILWASSPGAVFVVSAGSADLSAHRTGQATPLRFTTSAVPTRVTDDDVAETVDDALRMISGTNDRRVVGEWFEGMPRATVAPPIRSILVDSDGNPWVESWQRSDGRARWTIYSSDGRTLATLSTPAGSELLSVGPDWALGLRRDEYGVEQVTLFRLRRTS